MRLVIPAAFSGASVFAHGTFSQLINWLGQEYYINQKMEVLMNQVIYFVGLAVVLVAVLSFVGLV
jgi:hypothetical protein